MGAERALPHFARGWRSETAAQEKNRKGCPRRCTAEGGWPCNPVPR